MSSEDSPPCKGCRGQCCAFAPMRMREFKTIRKKHGIPAGSTVITTRTPPMAMVVTDKRTGQCAYLKDERCSIYEDRPWMCRVYGDNPTYPCKIARPEESDFKTNIFASLERRGKAY